MIIKTDKDVIRGYLEDSSNIRGGYADKLLVPENIEELACFLAEASPAGTPVTISGGGTGTTGSRVPFGGIVISTERLNRIMGISSSTMSAVVEPGVLVEELKSAAEREGLFYTSHPTEKMASVGGTIATNASGSRSFRYGPTRKYVKRLRMLLADGESLDIRRGQFIVNAKSFSMSAGDGSRRIAIPLPSYRMPEVKNAAGYYARYGMDLIDLFIGQEGTLSVITEIELGLVKKPVSIFSAFVFFKREEDAWAFSEELKNRPDAGILSIEYFDANSLELIRTKNPNVPAGMNAAIFFEEETGGGEDDRAMVGLEETAVRHGASIDDTWAAMNERDAELFTRLRYSVPEAVNEIIRRSGFQKFSTDIAVPNSRFLEMVRFYGDLLKMSGLKHLIFGHIGENHLHVNILPGTAEEAARARELSLVFVKKGVSLCGTVSAEHGIGKLKHKYLEEMYGKDGIMDMVRIKKSLDPNCILGLDNIFPKELLKAV